MWITRNCFLRCMQLLITREKDKMFTKAFNKHVDDFI